jgi:hypothetical protein
LPLRPPRTPAVGEPADAEPATEPGSKDASVTSNAVYGTRRSRLKGDDGMKIWTGWAILAYDLDTLAIRTR